MARTRLEWARWMLAKGGMRAFLVKPNEKNPIHGWSWYSKSTEDPDEFEEMFQAKPEANFGIWPGENFVAIDLDVGPGKDGIGLFNEICVKNDVDSFLELDTLTVATPSGGYHLYFKAPFPCGIANEFPDGIDVRGTNGYVVGPGSELSNGSYEILDPDAEIMDLPSWLEDYMCPPGKRDPKRFESLVEWDLEENVQFALGWLQSRAPAIEGQHGDQWTLETVYWLRDFGLSEEKILWAMNQGWNQECEPAWSDEALEGKIENAFSYPQNRAGIKAPSFRVYLINKAAGTGLWAKYLTPESKAELFRPSHNLRLVVDNSDERSEIPEDVDDDEKDPVTGEPAQSFPWRGFMDFYKEPAIREYVIDGWLLGHGVAHMVAKRGTGKSTVALDMACHIATDRPWCENQTQKGWKVIYICGEDDVGMRLNSRAWIVKHGLSEEEEQKLNERFLVAPEVIKLTDGIRLDIRIREMKEWLGDSRAVVFLDTWQRATSGWSKNDQEAMETAIDRSELVSKHVRGPLLSLVHPPKDGRMTVKGAGEQEDASAAIYHLDESSEGVRLRVERIKGPGRNNYIQFGFENYTLSGVDYFGNPLVGRTVDYIAGTVSEGSVAAKNRYERQLRAWATAIQGISKAANRYTELPEISHLNFDGVASFLQTVAESIDEDTSVGIDARDFENAWLQSLLKECVADKDARNLTKDRTKRSLEDFFGGDNPPAAQTEDLQYMMNFSKVNPDKPKSHRRFQFEKVQKIDED